MDTLPVPLIYSPLAPRVRVGPGGRLFALFVSLTCLTPLVIAALVRPDPSGLGTHTQLGLGACAFQQATGIPCPSCGMTTSWAWFARGNLIASLWVQPMGTVLAFLTVTVFWAGLYIAATGRAAHHLLRYIPAGYIVRPLVVLGLLAWAWKVFLEIHHWDGWR
jgi:hypothetical protein